MADRTPTTSSDGRAGPATADAPHRVAYRDSRVRNVLDLAVGAFERTVEAWDAAVSPLVARSWSARAVARVRTVALDAAVVRWARREPAAGVVIVEPGGDSLAGHLFAASLSVAGRLERAWLAAGTRRYGRRLWRATWSRAPRIGGVLAAVLLIARLALGDPVATPWGLAAALLVGGLALVALSTDAPGPVLRSSRTWRGLVALFEPPAAERRRSGADSRDDDDRTGLG